jgi:hypothetical protein
MRWFYKLRCAFRSVLSIASTATRTSPNTSRCIPDLGVKTTSRPSAAPARELHSISFMRNPDPQAYFLPISGKERKGRDENENYMTKLVRLARRKDSLLVRIDLRGRDDRTYTLGKSLFQIRVHSFREQRNSRERTLPLDSLRAGFRP